MARPKKLSDADAVRLVDSLYEQCGDHTRLKFSELEKHAVLLDMKVKAYDLRRNSAVLQRISEIEALELNAGGLAAIAYKDLDIDGFMQSNRSPDRLRRGLAELDGRWHKLYDYAAGLSKQVSTLTDELHQSETRESNLRFQYAQLSEQATAAQRSSSGFKAENSYLRKTIQKYLYPALANSILTSSREFVGNTSCAAQIAIDTMTDGDVPASFSVSIAPDCELRSREDLLFERLRLQAREGEYDE